MDPEKGQGQLRSFVHLVSLICLSCVHNAAQSYQEGGGYVKGLAPNRKGGRVGWGWGVSGWGWGVSGWGWGVWGGDGVCGVNRNSLRDTVNEDTLDWSRQYPPIFLFQAVPGKVRAYGLIIDMSLKGRLGEVPFLTHMQCNVSLCNGDSVRPAGRPAW